MRLDRAISRLAFLALTVSVFLILYPARSVQAADLSGPQLQALSIDPLLVHMGTQPQTITFTAQITDATGLVWGLLTITSPSGNQSHEANPALKSGNALNGEWTFEITIPVSAETGLWEITGIRLQDVNGNYSSFSDERRIEIHRAVSAPRLQSLTIDPQTVNAGDLPQTIIFSAQIADDVGFDSGLLTITSPSGNQWLSANAKLVSGNALDGIWIFPVTIPVSAETGAWKVSEIRLQNSDGEISTFTDERPIQIDGAVSAPRLQSLAIHPQTVYVGHQAQTVTCTARITDDAGLAWGLIKIASPSGNQTHEANAFFVSGSGDPFNGDWLFEITIPKSAEAGPWKISEIRLQNGNGDLFLLAHPGEIQVIAGTDVQPPRLESLSIMPTAVDPGSGLLTINLLARITDDVAGFEWGQITLVSPSGHPLSSSVAADSSGNSLAGEWIFPITLPASADTGSWEIAQILLQDRGKNVASLEEKRGIRVIRSDAASPLLTLFALPDGATTGNPSLGLDGAVTGGNAPHSVTVNDQPIPLTGGTFRTRLPLHPGANTITTIALDSTNNGSTDTLVVVLQLNPGDVDLSGRVDVADAILSLQVLSRMPPAATACREADIDGDRLVGMAEAIHALQTVAGLRPEPTR